MQHHNLYFKISIGLIIVLGLVLRLLHYDSLPKFNETADEFMYPWAGMSFLQTGVPTSWSGMNTYKEKEAVHYWGKGYNLVTPWIHKPLLYPVITGGVMLLTGATEFEEVRLSKLRLIPIAFGTLTIFLIALYGTLAFNRTVGVVAALLYATIPTIVIAGRLSKIENAMIPLTVLVLVLLSTKNKYLPHTARPYLIGIIAAIAISLKQTGIFIALAGIIYYLLKGRIKESILVAALAFIGVGLYAGMGAGYVGLLELVNFNTGLIDYHNNGLPQLISTLFRYPMIVNKASVFMDPFMLAGYVLLFSAPWWLPKFGRAKKPSNHHMLLLLPFTYLLVALVLQSGASATYGWHFFPLFPFVAILLGVFWHTLYTRGTFLQIVSAFLLFSPAVAWLLTLISPLKSHWQIVMSVSIISVLIIAYTKKKVRAAGLILILVLLVMLNVFTIYNAPNVLPHGKQPLSTEQSNLEKTKTKLFPFN